MVLGDIYRGNEKEIIVKIGTYFLMIKTKQKRLLLFTVYYTGIKFRRAVIFTIFMVYVYAFFPMHNFDIYFFLTAE